MRTTGNHVEAAALAPRDHAAWTYDDPESFLAAATTFLREGARRGERVGYVGGAGIDRMREVLDDVASRCDLADATFVADLGAMYQGGAPDPEEQVELYLRETRTAVRRGFQGLRVAADTTSMAADPDTARAFARYEHLIDHAMIHEPFTAMCGFDVTVVGEGAQVMTCLHPATNDPGSTFGVFASGPGEIGLRGELDFGNVLAFADTLERAGWPSPDSTTVDLSTLEFVDHRALLVLQHRLEVAGARVGLRSRSSMVADLVDLLGLDRLRVEEER